MVVFPTGQPDQRRIQHRRSTSKDSQATTAQINCVTRESRPTDLSESWPHKELLYNRPELINRKQQIIPVTHKEPHILSRPLKTMAHRLTQKEVHLLSGPSELQPATITLPHNEHGIITQYTPREKDQDLPQLPSTPETQHMHREPATAVSQALITSYKSWVDQHQMKMVRTPRDERQTRHNYSQLTENEKAKFQTPFTYNDQSNCRVQSCQENIR